MKNQKCVIEIFLYLILLCVFVFFYFTDFEVELIDDDTTTKQTIDETPYLEQVPEELIDYNYRFEGD